MGFSEDYLYRSYEENYRLAINLKDRGYLAESAKKLMEAAGYMQQLALMSTGEVKAKRLETVERLKSVAAAMIKSVPQPTVTPAPTQNYTHNTPSQNTGTNTFPTSTTGSFSSVSGGQVAIDEEMQAFFSFFMPDEVKLGFDGVMGLEKAKEAVREYVINPILYPDAYHYSFEDNKAILLYGPPGTGKTTFAKAVAKEISQPFALINVAALVNCYIGETGKNIDKVFAYLRNYVEQTGQGITVFFDELDEIAKKRGGDDKASAASVPALLRNMDGVKGNKGFLILANTNCPEMLDEGILDRFRKRIEVPLPDETTRKKLFLFKLDDVEDEYMDALDLDKIAQESWGLSGRSITNVCDDFKYKLAGSRAGVRACGDLTEEMLALIVERRRKGDEE